MIKINLITSQAKSSGAAEIDLSGGSVDSRELAKMLLPITLKMVGIFSGYYALNYYENDMLVPEKQKILNQMQQDLSQIQSKNNSVADVVEQGKKYEESEAKLIEQIQVLESLRGDSLREVKVLDHLQSEMPERMWLSKIELKTDNTIEFEGIAASDAEINNLIDILGKNTSIKEVNLGSTKEKQVEGFNLKEFKVSCVFNKYEINKNNIQKQPQTDGTKESAPNTDAKQNGGAG